MARKPLGRFPAFASGSGELFNPVPSKPRGDHGDGLAGEEGHSEVAA